MPRRTRAQMEADMFARLGAPQLDRKGRHCACCFDAKPITGPGWCEVERARMLCQ